MAIIIQSDATIYSLFISVNCSTCFGWYLHLSSGAHNTVSTVSGVGVLVLCTQNEYTYTSSHPVTSTTCSSNGLINAKYCRYRLLYFVGRAS